MIKCKLGLHNWIEFTNFEPINSYASHPIKCRYCKNCLKVQRWTYLRNDFGKKIWDKMNEPIQDVTYNRIKKIRKIKSKITYPHHF